VTEARVQLEALSDIGLVSLLIGPHQAERLYRGSLAALLGSEDEPGESSAILKAARELVKLVRRGLEEQLAERSSLTHPVMVADLLKVMFVGRTYEAFVVLYLDAANALISAEEMFRGTLTQTSVYPREIAKVAPFRGAAAVIIAHNHPSGAAKPSRADECLTQTLKSALALVDVGLLDHVVVAGSQTTSFAQRGLL
jgi:DNA repair protein RadC